jgi:hypothetical protein
VVENATDETWRNTRHELDRMHLVTLATADGQVAQRSATTAGQNAILAALKLPEPQRFFDFTVPPQAEPRPQHHVGTKAPCSNTTHARRIRVSAGHAPFSCSRVPIISGSPVFRGGNVRIELLHRRLGKPLAVRL